MFQGFSKETSDFYWELLFHNERPWFLEHREQFLRVLKEPHDALAKDTLAEFSRRHPELKLQLHISRIYRDARRLFGRGPYKEHLWFSIKDTAGLLSGPMFWFEVGAADWGYGMGFYDATPAQMSAWRAYVDANPAAVERLARRIAEQDTFRLETAPYKRPKADKGELLNPWYNTRWLGLECRRDFGEALYDPALPQKLCGGFDFLMPYFELFSTFYQPAEDEI